MSKTLTNGLMWSAIERLSTQGISFLLGLVVARLVLPSEYGLVAMLNIFMAIAQTFIDSGFGNALIQKKNRSDVDFSTVFYFNIAISVVLYILMYVSAPLIANFYNQPRLVEITRWSSLSLIIMSLALVQRTILTINLNFKGLAKISLVSIVLSGVIGVYTAYRGWGVWALVIQSIANNFFNTMLLWVNTKWYPSLSFSVNSFKQLFTFGSKLLASGMLHTIYLNLYSLVIGKFYNVSDVAYYNRAYSISQMPSANLSFIFNRTVYPIQCEHQDDNKWLSETFLKYLKTSCFVIFPLMTILAAIAKPLVVIILTDRWSPIAPLVSILSIAYMFIPVMTINNQILNVKGRSDLFFRAEVIKKIVAIVILCLTLPFGIYVLCMGVILYNIFDMLLIISYAKKVIPTGYKNQFIALIPITVVVLVAGSVSYGLQMSINSTPWLSLFIGVLGYLTVFGLCCLIIKPKELVLLKDLKERVLKK
jgi:O-antigen/teichoic acid export membrane protein